MNDTDILRASITLTEFLERVHQSKHKNRKKDLENFYFLHQIFGQMDNQIQDLNNTLSQSELNNSIMSTKITELERKNKDLLKKL